MQKKTAREMSNRVSSGAVTLQRVDSRMKRRSQSRKEGSSATGVGVQKRRIGTVVMRSSTKPKKKTVGRVGASSSRTGTTSKRWPRTERPASEVRVLKATLKKRLQSTWYARKDQ